MKIYISLLFLIVSFAQNVSAQGLLGEMDGLVYTDPKGVFTTTLPSIEGELKEFPNAVSVYFSLSGAQDSLEYYAVPSNEMEKYSQDGPKAYHAEFTQKSLIDKRYKDSFNKINIISEKLETINQTPMYITTIALPNGSAITDGKMVKQDLWVTLGTLIHGQNIFVYQVAVTDFGKTNPDELNQSMSKKIIEWATHTEFNG